MTTSITPRQPGDDGRTIASDLIPPAPTFPLGKIAWTAAVGSAYALAVLCTAYSIFFLRVFGFSVGIVLPLLFWNLMPWLFAAHLARRGRVARAALAHAEAEAVARRAALAQAVEAVTARGSAKSPHARPGRRHWWTDTQLREETKVELRR